MNLNSIQAVVFDMDGVIFDSEKGCLNVWRELTEEAGLADVDEVYRRCIGTTTVATAQILREAYGPDFDVKEFMQRAHDRFHELYDDGRLPVLPGARELLSFLYEKQVPIGLASSTKEATVHQQLTDAGLIGYFTNITCGDMLKVSKPEPDIYLLACKNLGVEPATAVAIEDSYNGIRSAYRAGMIPIMVPDLIPADKEMYTLASRVFENLDEVREYFES